MGTQRPDLQTDTQTSLTSCIGTYIVLKIISCFYILFLITSQASGRNTWPVILPTIIFVFLSKLLCKAYHWAHQIFKSLYFYSDLSCKVAIPRASSVFYVTHFGESRLSVFILLSTQRIFSRCHGSLVDIKKIFPPSRRFIQHQKFYPPSWRFIRNWESLAAVTKAYPTSWRFIRHQQRYSRHNESLSNITKV